MRNTSDADRTRHDLLPAPNTYLRWNDSCAANSPALNTCFLLYAQLPKQCDLDKVDVELLGSQVLLKEVVGAQGKVAQQQRPIKPTCCPCTIQ